MMENLGILNSKLFFLIEALIRQVRQYVCCSIYFTLTIINSKIVTRELLVSTKLTRAQTIYIHELLAIIIVSKNKEVMFAAF